MRKLLCLSVIVLAALNAFSQGYVFNDVDSASSMLLLESKRLVCFYKTNRLLSNRTIFKSTSLDTVLTVTDTSSYVIPGAAKRLAVMENDKFRAVVFVTDARGLAFLYVLITDKNGRKLSSWSKSAAEFKTLTGHQLDVKHLKISISNTIGDDSDKLVIRPYVSVSFGTNAWVGPILGFEMMTGKVFLTLLQQESARYRQIIKGRIFSLTSDKHNVKRFVINDLRTGKELLSTPIAPADRLRSVELFVPGDSSIFIAGVDARKNDVAFKNVRVYFSQIDFNGKVIADNIDTVDRFPGRRLEMLTAIRTADSYILIGESYHDNPRDKIAGEVGNWIINSFTSALAGGTTAIMPITTKMIHVVDNIVSVRLDPKGNVMEFNSFAVDSRQTFSQLVLAGDNLFFRNGKEVDLYDIKTLNIAPHPYAAGVADAFITSYKKNLIGYKRVPPNKHGMVWIIDDQYTGKR